MSSPSPGEVTRLLEKWSGGHQSALDELMPIVYSELRKIARIHLRRERTGHTLEATALTHEAYLRLVGQRKVRWQSRAHFFSVAAQMMRRILVEYARKRQTTKRGGGADRVTLVDGDGALAPTSVEVLSLHEALGRLAEMDPRQGEIVELRFFGGLTIDETAEVVGASPATVKREWQVAKLWLQREMEGS